MSTRATRLLPFLLLALTLAGCGSGGKAKVSEGTESSAPLTPLHVFEEHGDQPLGHYSALVQVGTQILAGTEDGVEIFEYDPETGFQPSSQVKLQASPASRSEVSRIRHGAGEEIWVAASDGLARFQGTRFQLQEQSGPARDATAFRGATWVARSNSLDVYEPELSKITPMPIELAEGSETGDLTGTRQPLSILAVSEDTVMVGTQFGILVATVSGDAVQWKHLHGKWDRVMGDSIATEPGNCPLPGNQVYNLRLSPDGKSVAACTDKGLAVFDVATQKDWVVYQGTHRVNRAEPGRGIFHEEVKGEVEMPSSDVEDVAFAPRHLFLATRKGLVMVSRQGPKAEPAKIFSLEEGLPSAHITGLDLDLERNILFVATRYGLAALRVSL